MRRIVQVSANPQGQVEVTHQLRPSVSHDALPPQAKKMVHTQPGKWPSRQRDRWVKSNGANTVTPSLPNTPWAPAVNHIIYGEQSFHRRSRVLVNRRIGQRGQSLAHQITDTLNPVALARRLAHSTDAWVGVFLALATHQRHYQHSASGAFRPLHTPPGTSGIIDDVFSANAPAAHRQTQPNTEAAINARRAARGMPPL
jgi:hypothetical protein